MSKRSKETIREELARTRCAEERAFAKYFKYMADHTGKINKLSDRCTKLSCKTTDLEQELTAEGD